MSSGNCKMNGILGFLVTCLFAVPGMCQGDICDTLYDESGVLDVPRPPKQGSTCWKIVVPGDKYVKIQIPKITLTRGICSYVNLKVVDTSTGRTYTFCPIDVPPPITALGDVIVTLTDKYQGGYSAFTLNYQTVDKLCNKGDSFRCTDTLCIDPSKVCDGVQDCANGKDESNCESLICKQRDSFRCSSTQCIERNKVCDGIQDCKNGNDERNCANLICNQRDSFRCSSIKCIERSKVCDGVQDCENGNDERNCGTHSLTR